MASQQQGLQHADSTFDRQVRWGRRDAELSRRENLVTLALAPLTDQFLVGTRSVNVRDIQ